MGRRGSPLSGTPVDTVALSALTHMRKLYLLPGPQLTVDTTLAPLDVVASTVDAAIHRKLFRVLSAHMAEAAIQLDAADVALARAACQRFNLPESSLDDLVQIMGDTLVAGCKAVAIRCKYCNAWHVDMSKFAVTPHRVHLCQACGARF